MAKEAKTTEKKPEEKKVEAPPAPKPIIPVEAESLGSLALTPYRPNQVAEFGNKFMASLVMQAAAEEEAQKALAAAGEAKQYLSFEMTRAVFDLSIKHEEGKDPVDIYAVFGEAGDVAKLNTNVLIHMGVQKREISEDGTAVVLKWTDPSVEKLYAYTKELKEKDPAEFDRRFNNRKRLNMRLNEAYRAAALLRDQNLTTDDLFYSEDDVGNMVPTIRNVPKAIGGDGGVIQMNQKKPVKGATLSPTMSSLVKLANDKHKNKPAKGTDKGENREGEAKLGMTDEAFGRIVNTLRQAITTQEGKYSEDMIKQIKALYQFIEPIAKYTAPPAELIKKEKKEAAE